MLLLLPVAGCARRHDVAAFWHSGGKYTLTLTAGDHAAPAASGDSAVLRLVADSVARDSVWGRFDGDTRHFPIVFRATPSAGDRFVALRDRERWRVVLNEHVGDAALDLAGELSHGQVSGRWESRSAARPSGSFVLAPAT